jgi:ketosteroid isomerase-like protein
MTFNSLGATLNPAHQKDWVAGYFRSADTGDIEAIAMWLSDDVEFRFANMPSVLGKANVKEGIGGFLKSLKSMKHEAVNLVESGDSASQQAIVTYTTFEDQTIALPVSTYLRRNTEGFVDRVWIYMDLGPLFAASGNHS